MTAGGGRGGYHDSVFEIIGIFIFCRSVGKIARRNGRRAIWLQLMTAALWIVFEFIGVFVGLLLFGVDYDGFLSPGGYAVAIGAAIIGGIFGILITKSIVERETENGDDGHPTHLSEPSDS